MKNFRNEVTIDDIKTDTNREIAEVLGIENALKLFEYFGGEKLFIGKASEIYKQCRDRKIRKEYNGFNIRELSKKYEITTKRIEQIVKDGK